MLGTIASGVWQGTSVGLGYGGTGAALTASAGGIVYSTGSALAILAGTAFAIAGAMALWAVVAYVRNGGFK